MSIEIENFTKKVLGIVKEFSKPKYQDLDLDYSKFPTGFRGLGVRTPVVRKIANECFRELKSKGVIDIDDLHFTVLYTPGHSQDGISLVGHGVVFSGDTLFNFGIGRTDFPGCSHARLMDSIHKKLMTMPEDTVVYPGHGPQTTIGDERKMNPFLRG